MILLTDISYFQEPIGIVNLNESADIAAEVKRLIRKHEPALLQDVLGWDLYTALQAALLVNPLADNFQKLLFGDRAGRWRGIIDADSYSSDFTNGNVTSKSPQWVSAGVTQDAQGTPLIPALISTFTIADWVGWTPIIYRNGVSFLQEGTDYSYDQATGTVQLLKAGDVFENGEPLFVIFLNKAGSVDVGATEETLYRHSFLANYIYYWYMRGNATFSTGIGEKKVSTSNTTDASPAYKMATAWNEMSEWIADMWCYLDANRALFPQWYGYGYRQLCKYKKINPYF